MTLDDREFPKPELLQRQHIGKIGFVELFVEPITDSPMAQVFSEEHPLKSFVHLEMVSEHGERFGSKDLDRMALNPGDIDMLWQFCLMKKDLLRDHYLPGLVGNSMIMRREHCFIDTDKVVHVSFVMHQPFDVA